MKVLVTSSRVPFALDLIRKLAEAGHEVYASDTYESAPGSHSRYLAGHFVTPRPRQDSAAFIEEIERIVAETGIELVLPAFEEVFYLSTRHDRLPQLFSPPFATLARVHDKWSFQRVCEKLGVPAPQTTLATSDEELHAAIASYPQYFARAAFSRGGVGLLTNTGPLAGASSPDDTHPTPASPWLVQEFVDGPMICTYSVVHDGEIGAHLTYRAPRQWQHSTGIQFETIDPGPTLAVVERIVGEYGWTGQVSFDFVDTTDRGLQIIECNPRPTDGLLLMSSDEAIGAIVDPPSEPVIVGPGRKTQLDFAVFGEMFTEGLKGIPSGIHDLLHIPDAAQGWHDHLPTFYSFLAFGHHERLSLSEHAKLLEAWSDDIAWNGEPIPGLSEADSAALREIESAR